ncbi:multicopper oxidase [Colletotrichum tofieldiae]|uniref:Multicopper oxidase n=1 Tax=Colletotrichum tofieldiae TaxID=708197 RepID=A0A166PAD7_9PEZI|nr:multicopper oxidase [Colletotrichum tofieldiae]
MPSSSFTNFPELPAELRLKVWGEATARPSMHIFDVCFPSWRGGDRSKRAFQATDGTMSQSSHARWTKYSECVFLDSLEVGPAELARQTSVARHAFDPSVYRFRRTMRLACPEASAAVWRRMRGKSVNTVYLPGRNERIQYDNDEDVLFLRFRDGGAITDLSHGALFGEFEASGMNGLTDILEGPWSTEMAETLRDAQCIALDVAETWDPSAIGTVLFEEVAQLQARGGLYRELQNRDIDNAMVRTPDIIYGVGKTYREVFDLEGLGWSHEHPNYVFARGVDEVIRSQQADTDKQGFEGVRVLLVEDEQVEGLDTTTLMDCKLDGASERFAGEVMNLSLRWRA